MPNYSIPTAHWSIWRNSCQFDEIPKKIQGRCDIESFFTNLEPTNKPLWNDFSTKVKVSATLHLLIRLPPFIIEAFKSSLGTIYLVQTVWLYVLKEIHSFCDQGALLWCTVEVPGSTGGDQNNKRKKKYAEWYAILLLCTLFVLAIYSALHSSI